MWFRCCFQSVHSSHADRTATLGYAARELNRERASFSSIPSHLRLNLALSTMNMFVEERWCCELLQLRETSASPAVMFPKRSHFYLLIQTRAGSRKAEHHNHLVPTAAMRASAHSDLLKLSSVHVPSLYEDAMSRLLSLSSSGKKYLWIVNTLV